MAKILLVEDNEMNRDMLARRLRRKGYEVLVAEDGQIAIDRATVDQPDLVLMDLSLPVVDGWQATRTLKAREATRHIPIIALTAHAISDDRDTALECGCDEYDTKPVDMKRLLSKMEKFLDGSA